MSERSERAARSDKPIARQRLETPVESRFRFEIDAEAVARGSETVARFLGTGRYLLLQTVVVVVWIGLNVFAVSLQWDPYPFILLNLAFSTQAAYAAPLILLAQNRQDNRDKVSLEEDRRRAAQTKADTEFLARELAALRIAVGEVATRDYLRRELEDIKDALARLQLHAPLDDEDAVETAKSKKSTDRKRGRVPISPQIDGG
ncbi:putative membrane protein [Nocardia kruczakiae]|uniref:Membrane protein n=1 Tax=Nocardia kruczakiae TaxID=261477 RepID=A0ABU1XNJ2_9NOCA|nr:DUF1003 domain-containing protein [Nocardia kruczakiae]MDR7172108.1 putative membrane protein [Nocardia kruczakiae]